MLKKWVFITAAIVSNTLLNAQQWKPLGPIGSVRYSLKTSAWGGGTGQIHAFAFAPQAGSNSKFDWYCASAWGGLWKSVNEGTEWLDLNPGLEKAAGICSADAIVADPNQPNTIYVANGRPTADNKPDAPGVPSTGVFCSKDGGATFMRTGLKFNYEDNEHIACLTVNPFSKPGEVQLFAATTQGVYMAKPDPQKKWQKVFVDNVIFSIAISPNFNDNRTVYLSGDDIYVSKKEGAKNSFLPMEPSVKDALPLPKTNRNIAIKVVNVAGKDVLYALVYQDGQSYFLYYNNNKWETHKAPIIEGIYIPTPDRLSLAVNPLQPDNVYAGITYVTRTDDAGKTWQLAGRYCQPGTQNDLINIHGDIHAVVMIPGTNDVLIGTDGGIFRYNAALKTETELNNGLNISQVVGMSAPPQASQRIIIGKQDTGFDFFDGSNWTNIFGGDGFSIHASPIDSNLYLCNLGYKFIYRNGRPEFEKPNSCKAGESALFSNVVFDPKVPERCIMGGTNISYSDDGAKTFTTIYKFHTKQGQPVDYESQIQAMAAGHDNATGETVVYASCYGFTNGYVCKMIKGRIPALKPSGKPCSEDLCSTCWVNIPLPNEKYEWLDNTSYTISGMAVSPDDPDEIWICYEHNMYDKDDMKVFHSSDGGNSWQAMDKGLSAYTRCTAMCYDDKTKFLYMGTAIGVYINKNDGSGWKPFGQGLPASYIKAIEIQQSIHKIRAGLYGRGVWEADLAAN